MGNNLQDNQHAGSWTPALGNDAVGIVCSGRMQHPMGGLEIS